MLQLQTAGGEEAAPTAGGGDDDAGKPAGLLGASRKVFSSIEEARIFRLRRNAKVRTPKFLFSGKKAVCCASPAPSDWRLSGFLALSWLTFFTWFCFQGTF